MTAYSRSKEWQKARRKGMSKKPPAEEWSQLIVKMQNLLLMQPCLAFHLILDSQMRIGATCIFQVQLSWFRLRYRVLHQHLSGSSAVLSTFMKAPNMTYSNFSCNVTIANSVAVIDSMSATHFEMQRGPRDQVHTLSITLPKALSSNC